MAEAQRAASSPASSHPAPKPRLRHPPRLSPPLRPGLDDRHDLRPPRQAPPPQPPKIAVPSTAPAAEVHPGALVPRHQLPPRSLAEWVILGVLLLGLGLNLAALLTSSRLSRSDLLLGATVLFAGLVLLILIEVCRRSAPPRPNDPD